MSRMLAVVVVTYNRCELLKQSLHALEKQTLMPNSVIVINNASTDGVTKEYLDSYEGSLSLDVIHSPQNTGGAGGFSLGVQTAYKKGFDWIFLIDDDVMMHENCLKELMDVSHPCMIAVREYKDGTLVERAAIEYNLSSPFLLNSKRCSVADKYQSREQMPKLTEVDNVAFEGFMIHRDVVQKIGYPEPKYFIFYDDADYALRAREMGFSILAVRDAILVRQLPFDQDGAIKSWKAYYMFRNLFYLHQKFGKNFFVKKKPYILAVGAMIVYSIKFKNLTIAKEIHRGLKDSIAWYKDRE